MTTPLPPGLPLPPFAQMTWLAFRPISYLETCRRLYGNSFTVRLPGYPPWIALTDPDDIRAVFTGKPEDLWAGPANAILKPVLRENSLLLLDAPRHITERKLMTPAFHGERMMAYGDTMVRSTETAMAGWPRNRTVALHPKLQALTLDIILRTVFGLEDPGRYARLRDLIVRFLEQSANPAMFLLIRANGQLSVNERIRKSRLTPIGRVFGLVDEMDTLLIAEFARRRAEGVAGREDILSQFLEMKDETGSPLSDAWIRDEMMTLLLAGHETTATALAWFFYHVARNPDVGANLRAELNTARGTEATPHDIMKLPYLDAAIKESMRLTPVISWVGRRLEKPMRIGQWDLPAGAMVLPSIYLTHHRPDLWPDPEHFDPQRFLGATPPSTAFFPFGGGARRCIGMAFANYEMKIVAARVLLQLTMELPRNYNGTPTRRSITLAPAKRLPVKLHSLR